MPNIQIDYSANLDDVVQATRLVDVLHQAAVDTGEFPIWGIRSFARAHAQARVADGRPERGFIQIMVRIAPGRDLPKRQQIAQRLFDAIEQPLAPFFAVRTFGCQLEVQEFDAAVTLNRTTLNRD